MYRAWAADIQTPRLTMVPAFRADWRTDGLQKIVGWLNTPEIVKYSELRHHRHTEQMQLDYIKIASPYWIIFLDDAMVGSVRATVDWRNNNANLGILIGDDYWGIGLGAEAWRAAMERLFAGGIRKVEAGMMADNHPMIGTCRSCGMVEEGRVKGHFLWNEEPMDMVLMGARQ